MKIYLIKQYKTTILIIVFIIMFKAAYNQSYDRFGVDTSGGVIPKGLSVNDIAPDFMAENQNGKIVHLYDLLKSNKVVLFFYRGNWCPFCNTYLQDVQDSLQYLLDKQAIVIAVSPEKTENIDKTIDKHDIAFSVLHDPGNKIMIAYNVLFNVTGMYQTKIKIGKFIDLAGFNDQDKAQLPVPATYVIDKNRKIIYTHFNVDFRQRAPISEILKHL